jgi:hypothetical protein
MAETVLRVWRAILVDPARQQSGLVAEAASGSRDLREGTAESLDST